MFPKLEGLDSLARRDGVDIRPTLVRVLTDLYVQKASHTSEEERHYTELVLRLLDSVDIPTLVRVLTTLRAEDSHTSEEERHYTELVLRLIDSVDLVDARRGRKEDRPLCGCAARGHAPACTRRDRSRRADPAVRTDSQLC